MINRQLSFRIVERLTDRLVDGSSLTVASDTVRNDPDTVRWDLKIAKSLGVDTIDATLLDEHIRTKPFYILKPEPSFGNITIGDQSYTLGTAIPVLKLPEASGGIGELRYSLSPLPDGLRFDATTRTLSGTPTAMVSSRTVTYRVTDANRATDTITFDITVSGAMTPTIYTMDHDFGPPPGQRSCTDSGCMELYHVMRANLGSVGPDSSGWEKVVTIGPIEDSRGGYRDLNPGTVMVYMDKVYWTDSHDIGYWPWSGDYVGRVMRAEMDGSRVTTLATLPGVDAVGMALHDGILFWSEQIYKEQIGRSGRTVWRIEGSRIRRSKTDGSGAVTIVNVTDGAVISRLSAGGSKIYWIESSGVTDRYSIKRSDFDGSDIEEVVVTSYEDIKFLVVHDGRVYWTDGDDISRANMDGSEITDLGNGGEYGIAIHNNLLYDGDPKYNRDRSFRTFLYRRDLDGGGRQEIGYLPGQEGIFVGP